MLKPAVLFVGLCSLALVGPSVAPAAQHGGIDITGDWDVDIEHKRRRCRWQGQVRLDQTGTKLTGSGEAAAPPAQRFCPFLKGAVEGSVDGPRVKFGFATGGLGTGEFEGALLSGGRRLEGTWTARTAAGTWRAERVE